MSNEATEQLTPAERLGYKIGDRFITKGSYVIEDGSLVSLYKDNGSDIPVFLVEDEEVEDFNRQVAYILLENVQPIGATDVSEEATQLSMRTKEKIETAYDAELSCAPEADHYGSPTLVVTGRTKPAGSIAEIALFRKVNGIWVLYEIVPDEIFPAAALLALALKLQELNAREQQGLPATTTFIDITKEK